MRRWGARETREQGHRRDPWEVAGWERSLCQGTGAPPRMEPRLSDTAETPVSMMPHERVSDAPDPHGAQRPPAPQRGPSPFLPPWETGSVSSPVAPVANRNYVLTCFLTHPWSWRAGGYLSCSPL